MCGSVKARSQSLEANVRTYRWNENKGKECTMCGSGHKKSVYHVIVEYVRYEREKCTYTRGELGMGYPIY